MSNLRGHVLRYLGWAAAGAVLFPLVLWLLGGSKPFRDANAGLILVTGGLGAGVVFVFIRAVVGAVGRRSGTDADRSLARGLVRFAVGAAGGVGILVLLIARSNRHLSPWVVLPGGGMLEAVSLLFALAGAVALVVVGAVGQRKPLSAARLTGRSLAWLGLFALLVAGWLAADRHNRQRVSGVVTGERFAWREPVSYWLNELRFEEPERRRTAAYALSDVVADEPRVMDALREALADPDPELQRRAAYALGKAPGLDVETVRALLRAAGAARTGERYEFLSALDKATPEALGAVIPELCRLLPTEQERVRPLLLRARPTLRLPTGYFRPSYINSRPELEANAVLTAEAVTRLGPEAVAAYRAALRELLASERSQDRRFAAYAIGGFGAAGRDDTAALLRVVDQPENPFDSDSLAAAVALAKVADPTTAARAFVVILRRENFVTDRWWDIDPWAELRKLPAAARDAVRGDIPPEKRELLDRTR